MYPYDENNNTPSGGNNNEQRCDTPAEDGSYRIEVGAVGYHGSHAKRQ